MPRWAFASAFQFSVVSVLFFVTGCMGPYAVSNFPTTNAQQLNLLHRGDPNLAGVIIYKDDPVNMPGDPPRKPNEHPLGVSYYFWSGTHVRHVTYDEKGKIVCDVWRKRFTPIPYADWVRVNFSYGSDPKFKRHPDPRGGRGQL